MDAPAFKLKAPDGQTVDFPADAHGHPTVLMFWPSWCPFSRALQPYIDQIWKDYKNSGVKVWTINFREDKDPVQVMKDRGLSFPLLLSGDNVAVRYGVQYTPWLVVVDGRNRIVYTRPPYPPSPIDTTKEVRAKLNELLGDKAVPLPTSYPKPYDLHLRNKSDLNKRRTPKPISPSVWGPWVTKYLGNIPQGQYPQGYGTFGPVSTGNDAIRAATKAWTRHYGAEATHDQAPYRAFRDGNRWIVLGDGLNDALGYGFVFVVDADTGRVVKVARDSTE